MAGAIKGLPILNSVMNSNPNLTVNLEQKEVLRHLLDHYGPSTSRYSPKRIYVLVEPGDKYEPPAQMNPV